MEEKVSGFLRSIPRDKLVAFSNHPFVVRCDEAMEKLVESIYSNGILNPVLVRSRYDGRYEIIAGHRRVEAGRILNLPYIPCIVCDMDDDRAIVAMTDSNLSQRERLLPSEKAFALRMKTEASRRIMLATHGRSDVRRASENVAKQSGMSARHVERFIKLTNLNRQFLNLLDAGKMRMNVALEIASLSTEEQCWVFDYINAHNMTLSLSQAKKLRQAIQQDGVTEEGIGAVLMEPEKSIKQEEPEDKYNQMSKGRTSETLLQRQMDICDDPIKVMDEQTEAEPITGASNIELDYERIRAHYPSETQLEFIRDDIYRLVEFYERIRTCYPPDLSSKVIDDDICSMLEVRRRKRVYGY